MFSFYVKRNWEIDAPLEACVENNLDWTHFIHCHGKSIKQYTLLHKEGGREIFLYKARILWPFPFHKTYIVFRNYEKEPGRYRNLYLDVKSGLCSYLDAKVQVNEERGTSSFVSEYLYELPDYWRAFSWAFPIIFKRRMRKLADEDNLMIYARLKNGQFCDAQCGPVVPVQYDFFTSNFIKDFSGGEASFYDHYFRPRGAYARE